MDKFNDILVTLTGFEFQQMITIAVIVFGTIILYKIFGKTFKTVLLVCLALMVISALI